MIATMLAVAATFAPGVDESFETMSVLPPDWQVVEYHPGVSAATLKTGAAADGRQFLRLSSTSPNHVRVHVPTEVEPEATYRLSFRVRSRGPDAVPAVVNVEGTDPTTDPVPGDGRWHARRLYLRTGEASSITVLLSLGWYGQIVDGQADFDLVKLKKVEGAPDGVPVAAPASASPVAALGPSKAMVPLTILLLVLIAGCGGVLVRGGRAS